jgi:two-component sensor histidine kinase
MINVIHASELHLKKRLFLVAVAALAPAVALLGYNEFAFRRTVAADVTARAVEANRQAVYEFQRISDGAKALLVATSAIPAVQAAGSDPASCKRALETIVKSVAWIRTILVIDMSGKLTCDTLGTPIGMDFGDRTYFSQALATNAFHIGEFTNSRLSNSGILPVALPIRDESGRTVGVLATALRLDWLNDQLRERGVTARGALTVADRNGFIIARAPSPERFVGTRIPERFQRLVNAEKEGVEEVVSQDGTVRILGYSPVKGPPEGLYISVGLSKDEAFAAIDRQSYIGVISIGLGICLALIAAWLAGGLIRRPLDRIASVISDWRSGGGQARTGLDPEKGDVEAVGAALDDLLDELARRAAATAHAEGQRDLLMHELAHRMKNTLAIVQAIVSQTMKHSGDMESAAERISGRLSALSAAQNILTETSWSAADVVHVVESALHPHVDGSERVKALGPHAEISAQQALGLSLALHELATNAIKYGALSTPDGRVDIEWLVGSDRTFRFEWRESGGPAVVQGDRKGFGSRLTERIVPSYFGGEAGVHFEPRGLRYALEGFLEHTNKRPVSHATKLKNVG